MSEQYLASDCTKCKREFNYLEHKHDTCIDCMPVQFICHALNCNNETDETLFYCDSNKHTLCGDCLIPLEECEHAKELSK